jgi:hypothetical protein
MTVRDYALVIADQMMESGQIITRFEHDWKTFFIICAPYPYLVKEPISFNDIDITALSSAPHSEGSIPVIAKAWADPETPNFNACILVAAAHKILNLTGTRPFPVIWRTRDVATLTGQGSLYIRSADGVNWPMYRSVNGMWASASTSTAPMPKDEGAVGTISIKKEHIYLNELALYYGTRVPRLVHNGRNLDPFNYESLELRRIYANC